MKLTPIQLTKIFELGSVFETAPIEVVTDEEETFLNRMIFPSFEDFIVKLQDYSYHKLRAVDKYISLENDVLDILLLDENDRAFNVKVKKFTPTFNKSFELFDI